MIGKSFQRGQGAQRCRRTLKGVERYVQSLQEELV
jgi:hypothetical protein